MADTSLALLTDLYQLTMAQAAFSEGLWEHEGVFHLFFRKAPFKSGFTMAAGLDSALDFLRDFHFSESDLAYLATLEGANQQLLFTQEFLAALGAMKLAIDVDAVPEGTLVFPQEPLLRVKGPVWQAMLLETPLLNLINFQTLIATKAARISLAARGDPVLEFGLRRAQGVDGALSASRAAYLGGCASTSNVLAGKTFGIPVRGTHAHSWVMLFDDELEAFRAYARALPGNCVFLVDTYDTLPGVAHAIEVGKWLREHGHQLNGIRLDSGDLAWLSIEARKLLDAAGFTKTAILASNDLDEQVIASLKEQGAAISVWGVGTRLVTGGDEPALGGVYKLSAVRAPGPGSVWRERIKLSEQAIKVSTPGFLQVRRFHQDDPNKTLVADAIYDEQAGFTSDQMVDPLDPLRRRNLDPELPYQDLLVPVLRAGKQVYATPPLAEARAHGQRELARLLPGHKRQLSPHIYPVGLERSLHDRKAALISSHRDARDLRGSHSR
jgi:nicotinate phosphoribosyltransferase